MEALHDSFEAQLNRAGISWPEFAALGRSQPDMLLHFTSHSGILFKRNPDPDLKHGEGTQLQNCHDVGPVAYQVMPPN